MPESIEIQLKKGALELCVLALLEHCDTIGMGEGTIYPLMRRLQTDRLVETYLVESPAGPSRKYYRLTDAGKASLASQKSAWSSFSGAVESILGGAK